MKKDYELVVRSDVNYERLIVEIKFPGRDTGIIVSQEEDMARIEVTLFSLFDRSRHRFFETEKLPNNMLDFDLLMEALSEARSRLRALDGLS